MTRSVPASTIALPVHPNDAGIGLCKSGDEIENRGFSATTGTEQAVELSASDFHRRVFERAILVGSPLIECQRDILDDQFVPDAWLVREKASQRSASSEQCLGSMSLARHPHAPTLTVPIGLWNSQATPTQ